MQPISTAAIRHALRGAHSVRLSSDREELGAELEFVVRFDYSPPEPRTWDYPGAPSEIDVVSATLVGVVDYEAGPVSVADRFTPEEKKEEEDRAVDFFQGHEGSLMEMEESAVASVEWDADQSAEAAYEARRDR